MEQRCRQKREEIEDRHIKNVNKKSFVPEEIAKRLKKDMNAGWNANNKIKKL